ncbi:hypothetical protein [Enterococcus xiangfangensis]|uniref:hypothetical protein n=1 Tax=Enterococcus xiangfangensis TaxID=1296537 RepID=UPI003D17B584|nr:hypothetical protein [Enterococcus asini]
MKSNKYLIACLDNADRDYEMKEYYLLILSVFFPRGNFKMIKDKSLITNGALSFYFMTPNQLNSFNDQAKFVDVVGSRNFNGFASFDSKHAYEFFRRKVGKVNKHGILQKLSESRKQSNR